MQLQPTKLQSVRGTHDLLPEEQRKHNYVLQTAQTWADRFGFSPMSTPIFEFSNVFKRTLGEASDIVNKEMYTFTDRGGEEITLRPEGTAPIARAFISEGLQQNLPLKFLYHGPMFRYERPQKGRQRQFHQVGIEYLGVSTPEADVECLLMAHELLKSLGILDKCTLEINSIGDQASRNAYREALVKYLTPFKEKLSPDSQTRLTVNPLRILDSKSREDQEVIKAAPRLEESWNEESKNFFKSVTDQLTAHGIKFNINPQLVRGLDYYNHCVFEFKTQALGAQDAVLSGGRYDNLIESMGGPATPGVGWAAGMERLVLLTSTYPEPTKSITVIAVTDDLESEAQKLAQQLRVDGYRVDQYFSGNMSKRLKKAVSRGARYAIVMGPDEWSRKEVQLKDLDKGSQANIPVSDLKKHLVF